MNKLILLGCLFAATTSFAQFAPEPGEPGTTAIYKDSSCFTAWADNGIISRGYIDINDTTATYNGSNRATFGELSYAFGHAQGIATNVVSLGDSGYITLTFPQFIVDGPGFDFAIFENGFDDNYMELAHVEVSSDGANFFRFPSVSNIPTVVQLSNSSYSDCEFVNNLAGKYRVGYGTPFDLAAIPDDQLLNKQGITHVRILDAIGAITGTGTTDAGGTRINDPYPTAFASGGFDLDAVGIINGMVGLNENSLEAQLWPNPTTGKLIVRLNRPGTVVLWSIDGKLIRELGTADHFDLELKELGLEAGMYQLSIDSAVLKKIVLL
jgi:hypothetical protein